MMNRIAEEVQTDPNYQQIIRAQRQEPEQTGADAIATAARQMTETLDLRAIVVWTASGASALRIARERPEAPILCLTISMETARRLSLAWGVHAVIGRDPKDARDMTVMGADVALRDGFARRGQRVVLVAGVPFGTPGATNMVRLAFVGTDNP
jgi:pyruvate kinase